MRFILLAFICIAVVVVAVPLEIDVIEDGKHLRKRGTDAIIADAVKAIVAFGAFIWGGGIIARRGVDYYFGKKAALENEQRETKRRQALMIGAKIDHSTKSPAIDAS
jgi:hypothetical protein